MPKNAWKRKRSSELHVNAKVTLDDLFNQIQQGELKELPLIIKGDVQGSVEALSQSLMGIKSDEVRISIVHSASAHQRIGYHAGFGIERP